MIGLTQPKNVVHKITLRQPYRDMQTFELPTGAKILRVSEQHGMIVIWFLTRFESGPTEYRRFVVVLTGQESEWALPDQYLGTAVLDGGNFVVHVFEVTR